MGFSNGYLYSDDDFCSPLVGSRNYLLLRLTWRTQDFLIYLEGLRSSLNRNKSMKQYLKIFSGCITFALAILLTSHFVFANTGSGAANDLYQIDNASSLTTTSTQYIFPAIGRVKSGTAIGTLRVDFQINGSIPQADFTASICGEDDNSFWSLTGECGDVILATVTSTVTVSSGTRQFYDFAFGTTTFNNPAKFWYFRLSVSGSPTTVLYGSNDSGSYVASSSFSQPGQNSFIYRPAKPVPAMWQAYYCIVSVTCSGNINTIDSITPPESSSISYDFSQWVFDYINNSSTAVSGSFQVEWSTSSSFAGATFDSTLYTALYPVGTTRIYVTKSAVVQANTTYYVRITNLSRPSETLSYSFNTGTPTYTLNTNPPLNNPFFATSTDNSNSWFFVDCSAYDGTGFFSSSTLQALRCYAKKTAFDILEISIVPPDFITTYMQNTWGTFQATFPFSIPFAVKNNLEDALASAAATSSATLSVTIPGTGISNATLLSPTMLQNAVGTSTYNLYNTVQSAFIWIGALAAVMTLIL